ncbi:phage replisome organizer N-terminal domain-containing protein [Megasphaera paucivorans]|uniref:Phage replisome organizer, putative, N-terminal region n=1 Tax=Megasphaera paucivorans TaxID=349095 RepID=A0A1G9SMB5_9FIRM|nr:phage replisome organizer N-terminal domain-containing protein [Megasphaera paucivorans]SDM36582.1 phage replisome organizer, putative, N-terminal region [Megasphaera paucivorans]
MKQLQWLKTQVGIFDTPKVRYMLHQPNGDSYYVIWCMLKDMAGKINDRGYIYLSSRQAMTAELLARHLGRRKPFMEKVLELFEELELLVREENGMIRLLTWEEDQDYDTLQRRREHTRKRVAAYRQRQAAAADKTDAHHLVEASCFAAAPQTESQVSCEEAEKADLPEPLQRAGDYYQQHFGMISAGTVQELRELEADWGTEAVCDAIDKAYVQGKSHIRYIQGILRNSPRYTQEEQDNEFGFSPAVARKLNQLFSKTGPADR